MTSINRAAITIVIGVGALRATDSPTDIEISKTSALVSAKPDSAEAWARYGDALMQKGRETGDAAYANRAESAYKKTLILSPKRLDALVGMAWVTGVRHEFELSIEWAQKALAVDERSTAPYGLIGDAAVEMGDYDRAYVQYQKMLDLRPDLSSYGRSAHLLHLTGDSRKASFLMYKAIQAGSPYAENTAWCKAQLALMMFSEGAYVPAEKMLEEGLQKAPNDYRLLAAMGKVAAAKKDYRRAIDYYKKALEITPQQETVAALGDLYALTDRPGEAQKQYAMVETIAQLNRANGVTGDMTTARFYADHDRKLAEALKMAEEEYRTRKNVYAADTLAWCLFKNGKIAEAKRYIDIALSQKTPEAVFHFHKGMIYAAAGDRGTAQRELYTAMSISPNFDPLLAPVAMKKTEELGSGAVQSSVR